MRGSGFDQQDNNKKEGEVHLRSKKSSHATMLGCKLDFGVHPS